MSLKIDHVYSFKGLVYSGCQGVRVISIGSAAICRHYDIYPNGNLSPVSGTGDLHYNLSGVFIGGGGFVPGFGDLDVDFSTERPWPNSTPPQALRLPLLHDEVYRLHNGEYILASNSTTHLGSKFSYRYVDKDCQYPVSIDSHAYWLTDSGYCHDTGDSVLSPVVEGPIQPGQTVTVNTTAPTVTYATYPGWGVVTNKTITPAAIPLERLHGIWKSVDKRCECGADAVHAGSRSALVSHSDWCPKYSRF
jgi:hypothetical protein